MPAQVCAVHVCAAFPASELADAKVFRYSSNAYRKQSYFVQAMTLRCCAAVSPPAFFLGEETKFDFTAEEGTGRPSPPAFLAVSLEARTTQKGGG